jgi:hypothetical protein
MPFRLQVNQLCLQPNRHDLLANSMYLQLLSLRLFAKRFHFGAKARCGTIGSHLCCLCAFARNPIAFFDWAS